MRILFVMPAHGRKRWVFPSCFAFLSAYLKKYLSSISIDYIDINHQSEEVFRERIKKGGYEIIAFTGLTSHYSNLKELIRLAREEKKERTKIVVGGAVISSYPQFMIDKLGADFYVLGEGEEAFLDLVKAIAEEKSTRNIKNIGFKEGEKIIINERRPLIKDLDALPWQDYDTFDFAAYSKKYQGIIFASRGCPFNCNFCYRLYGPYYRVRSIDNVIEEIKYLVKKYGIYSINFTDELFFPTRSRIEEFCKRMIKENLKITWKVSVRVELVDLDILKLMKKAGCMIISYGIEHGNQEMLERMNKKTTVERNIKALKETKEAGIFPGANCIIGYPGETKETIKDLEKMLHEAKCHGGIHFAQALPGCTLYRKAVEEGFIKDEEKYFLSLGEHIHDLPVDFTGLSKEFIEKEQERIVKGLEKYYIKDFKKLRFNEVKFYIRKGNINYLRHLLGVWILKLRSKVGKVVRMLKLVRT